MTWTPKAEVLDTVDVNDLPTDAQAYVDRYNEPVGILFQDWVTDKTQEDPSLPNLVDFLVGVNVGRDAKDLYEHFCSETEAQQPINWSSNYRFAELFRTVSDRELLGMTEGNFEGAPPELYVQTIDQTNTLALQWLGDVYIKEFMVDAKSAVLDLALEHELDSVLGSGSLPQAQNVPEAQPVVDDNAHQTLLEELIEDNNPHRATIEPEMETLVKANWPMSYRAVQESNAKLLKDSPEDRNGANALNLYVYDQWVVIGDTTPLVDEQEAFFLQNATKGKVWIPKKGGVFSPGVIAVQGEYSPEQKNRIEKSFGEFSKKEIEFS